MTKRNVKRLEDFEQAHGAPKIRTLERRLEVERAKVEALADVQGKVVVERRKDCTLRLAVIGDTHIGSLYAHTAALESFYAYCKAEGVHQVLHTGDVLDGHHVYRGQEFELRDLGLDAQIERLSKVAPRDVPTAFITGNHDQSFKTAAGVPVGRMIADATGWRFLGEEQARIEYETPNGSLKVMLVHPGGGAKAYALSYPLQQQIGALEGGTKPDIYAAGHYHKATMIPSYRNVCGILAGTFQRQTPFMARQSLAAHVGGWIVDATVGQGCNVIAARFVAFYV